MRIVFLLASLFVLSGCARQNAMGESAMRIVVESKDDDARWHAIRKLGELKYRPAITLLIKSLSDSHHYVRANAARALSDMNVEEAKRPLVDLISVETDGGVIQQATLGIRKFKAREALPSLRKLTHHEDSQTRIWVLQTIGQFGSKNDIPLVASFLDSSSPESSFAAETLGHMVGQDFSIPPGPSGFENVQKAKIWWEANRAAYLARH
jgi:HEAT repeat protein